MLLFAIYLESKLVLLLCRYGNGGFNPFVLSRGTIGKESNTFFSTWHLRDTYRFKVLGAKNVNVIDTMKVILYTFCILFSISGCCFVSDLSPCSLVSW